MSLYKLNPFTGSMNRVSRDTPGIITFINAADLNNDKFLSLQQPSAFTSNENPFIVPFDTAITAISFINKKDGVGVDLQLRINEVVSLTWSLTNVRRAIKTNGLSGLVIVAGDIISLSAINVSNPKPRDVLVHIHLAYNSAIEQEINSPTL